MIIPDQAYESLREAIVIMATIADAEQEQSESQMELFAADEVKTAWIELLMILDEAYAKSTELLNVTKHRKTVS